MERANFEEPPCQGKCLCSTAIYCAELHRSFIFRCAPPALSHTESLSEDACDEQRALEIHRWVHEQMQHQEYTNTQLNINLKLPKIDYARLVELAKRAINRLTLTSLISFTRQHSQ